MKPKLEVAPKPRSQIISHERLKQGIMALPNVPIFPPTEKLDWKIAKKPMKQQSKYHKLFFVYEKCFFFCCILEQK
jgi:hypothetical protein